MTDAELTSEGPANAGPANAEPADAGVAGAEADAGHADLPVAARVRRLEDRLIAAGLTSDKEIDGSLESPLYSGASPVNGARLVARAWTDEEFRGLLLADGNAAAAQLGMPVRGPDEGGYRLQVVANTEKLHNMIVCTLCSCYPVSLLGPSPGWYKSFAYRSRAVREPRAVLAEFGMTLPDDVRIQVWDSTSQARYMVLPLRPPRTRALGQGELAAAVTRNGLIGTAPV